MKIKFTLEWAKKAQMYSSTFSLSSALDGVGGQGHGPGQILGTHRKGGCVGPRAGLDRCGKSRPPPGLDPLDGPARNESLYRLSYRAQYVFEIAVLIRAIPVYTV